MLQDLLTLRDHLRGARTENLPPYLQREVLEHLLGNRVPPLWQKDAFCTFSTTSSLTEFLHTLLQKFEHAQLLVSRNCIPFPIISMHKLFAPVQFLTSYVY
jgi:hypothetical protein